jgi:integrase
LLLREDQAARPKPIEGKTGKRLLLPVSDMLAGYVAKVSGNRDELVVNERTGRQYEDYEFSKIVAEIREAAQLPSHLWVADLRRTCLTELRRLGASDDQLISVSGHIKRQSTHAAAPVSEERGVNGQSENALAGSRKTGADARI